MMIEMLQCFSGKWMSNKLEEQKAVHRWLIAQAARYSYTVVRAVFTLLRWLAYYQDGEDRQWWCSSTSTQ